ncbi:MAG TPA: acyltransferase [Methylomusa anaerophila]|uniref:Acyltransferase family protein n=1 Tax=Methylomusa anaerophila TaxID=1930071 RepID=A0A348ANS7_9FIRM|nr:acyltransferase [Methylomusa anaerophila]BBB92725.1 acyltransferase family protein [Methylomusa anaerophila]HML87422.1 acyltransferase [Methylomusa anaerophila]
MTKLRIPALDYIRGLSMLGVIGIHTGAYSLTNPNVNIHLFALLEIFTRFSVPIFFFVSSFGLFWQQPLNGKFDYLDFMRRRFRVVLLPYLMWSILYMVHYTWVTTDMSIWEKPLVFEYFAFGLASYQLYFLVILMWFYLLMPLWRLIVRRIVNSPVPIMSVLLILQIVVNYYSSYLLQANFENRYLNIAIQHRMSYLIVHYVFIFILGAVCAVMYPQFAEALRRCQRSVWAFFTVSLAGMLAYYYFLLYFTSHGPESAVNIVHQLSPIGVIYTLAATLFWFRLFNTNAMPSGLSAFLSCLGKYSYPVYLVHPLVMYYLAGFLQLHHLPMTVAITVVFYVITVCASIAIAMAIRNLGLFVPFLNLLLTGSVYKRNDIKPNI